MYIYIYCVKCQDSKCYVAFQYYLIYISIYSTITFFIFANRRNQLIFIGLRCQSL